MRAESVRAAAFFEWVVAEKRRLKIDAFMRRTFPSSTLVEQATAHSMRYKVDQTEKRETQGQEQDSITLAHMFDSIEQCKNDLGITEYSVGQTTLTASQACPKSRKSSKRLHPYASQTLEAASSLGS
mgnify:CR=1 FL=1